MSFTVCCSLFLENKSQLKLFEYRYDRDSMENQLDSNSGHYGQLVPRRVRLPPSELVPTTTVCRVCGCLSKADCKWKISSIGIIK